MSSNIVSRKKDVVRILSLYDGKIVKCIKEPNGNDNLNGFYVDKFYVRHPTVSPRRVKILGSKTRMYSSVLPKEIYDNALQTLGTCTPEVADAYFREIPIGEFLDLVGDSW